MTASLPRRHSRMVFWISATAIVSAIAATALFANDKRNLRLIAERYQLRWLEPILSSPPAEIAPPAPAAPAAVITEPTVGKLVSQHLIAGLPGMPGEFLRRWNVSGTHLCEKIAEAGFTASRWHQSDLDASTSECSYETPVADNTASEQPSLFVIVRGSPSGDIGNIRIKAILPETEAGNALKLRFQALFRTIARRTEWRELTDAEVRIDRLDDVNQTTFGTRLFFGHEFENPRRFNLIIDLERPSAKKNMTVTFFDRSKWLPLPAKL